MPDNMSVQGHRRQNQRRLPGSNSGLEARATNESMLGEPHCAWYSVIVVY